MKVGWANKINELGPKILNKALPTCYVGINLHCSVKIIYSKNIKLNNPGRPTTSKNRQIIQIFQIQYVF